MKPLHIAVHSVGWCSGNANVTARPPHVTFKNIHDLKHRNYINIYYITINSLINILVNTTPVFPTHRLYLAGRPSILTAAQVYLVTHFCFITIIILHFFFFLSARDNETIRDRLTSWKSPRARRVSHCLFCVLKNCRHSLRQALSLYLWRAATISTTRSHQLPPLTHKSATFSI